MEVEVTDSEASLVDAAMAGGIGAFAALYDRYMERVYRYIYYHIGKQADAEDLTQQVFLNAWKAVGRYKRTGATFFGWLLAIAHNEVVSFFRKSKVTFYFDLEPAAEQRWANPEMEAESEYDRLTVRRAILRLKPEQQKVIVMRFIEGLDYADIAAALGKSEGNIRVIQHRALTQLRHLLGEEATV